MDNGEDDGESEARVIDWASFWRRQEGWDEVEEWHDGQRRRKGLHVPYVPRVSEVSAELMVEQIRRERQINEAFPPGSESLLQYLDNQN